MAIASTTISGIIIGPKHGISAERLKHVQEYFDGKTEAITCITYEKMTMYLMTITDIFMLILILNVEVKFVGMIWNLIQFLYFHLRFELPIDFWNCNFSASRKRRSVSESFNSKCSSDGDQCDPSLSSCCDGLMCFDWKGMNRCIPEDVRIGEVKGIYSLKNTFHFTCTRYMVRLQKHVVFMIDCYTILSLIDI